METAVMYKPDTAAGDSMRDAIIETLPCGLILLDKELCIYSFNEASQDFFNGVCRLSTGLELDALVGALWDIAAEGDFSETGTLAEHIRAFEECTVDYRRFDGKQFRINAKPTLHTGIGMLIMISDISDITESENILAERGRVLANQHSALSSRLKLADAIVSEREARRLGKQFAGRLLRTLDRFEEALQNGNTNEGLAELEKQREYAGQLASGGIRSEFAQRFKKSVCPDEENSTPKIEFHHIAAPGCGELLENGIIEAACEAVILITVCGTADTVGVSLRVYEGGMELNIRSDDPVVPDFERSGSYLRLQRIVRGLRARIETDTSNGFDLKVRCEFPVKAGLPIALVVLKDAGFAGDVCEVLGGGAKPLLRCIAASSGIDLIKACQKYSPAMLITEPQLIENCAGALKSGNKKLKIIVISAPGKPVSAAVRLFINGCLSREIGTESLRAAASGVMRGLAVWEGRNPSDHTDEIIKQYGLSEVEQNIIRMTGQGMSSDKIAAELHYSQGSLRNMLSAIYVKLDIGDKAQLTAFAILNGFANSFY